VHLCPIGQRALLQTALLAALVIGPIRVSAQIPGYGGPSVLSRAPGELPGNRPRAQLQIRPFASVTAGYEWGLTPADLNNEGNPQNLDSARGFGTFGVSGVHLWKNSSLGVMYRGRGRLYSRAKELNGLDHALAVGFTQQATPKFSYSLMQSGGIYERGLGFPGGSQFIGGNIQITPGPISDALSPVAEDDLVDTQTYYLSSMAVASYQVSPRTVATAGGGAFRVRRTAASLAGMDGYVAFGGTGYALNRRTTIGVNINFVRFDFTRAFGNVNAQTGTVYLRRTLSRRWTGTFYAGAFRLRRSSLVNVALDPEIAAILGQRTGIEISNRVALGLAGGVNAIAEFRRSMLLLGFQRGIVPGNGLYAGVLSNRAQVRYSYAGIRDWSISWTAMYNRSTPVKQGGVRGYENYLANTSISRRITGWLHFATGGGIRRVEIVNQYHRTSAYATVGLIFAPGDLPVSFW
jgi:hypothetical protein